MATQGGDLVHLNTGNQNVIWKQTYVTKLMWKFVILITICVYKARLTRKKRQFSSEWQQKGYSRICMLSLKNHSVSLSVCLSGMRVCECACMCVLTSLLTSSWDSASHAAEPVPRTDSWEHEAEANFTLPSDRCCQTLSGLFPVCGQHCSHPALLLNQVYSKSREATPEHLPREGMRCLQTRKSGACLSIPVPLADTALFTCALDARNLGRVLMAPGCLCLNGRASDGFFSILFWAGHSLQVQLSICISQLGFCIALHRKAKTV